MKLSRKSFYTIILSCALVVAGTAVFADDEPTLSTSLDLACVSKYVWRGIPVNDDAAAQPSLTVEHANGLSLNFWGSMDATDVAGQSGNFTELDYTLNYVWADRSGHPLNVGLIVYTFPNTDFDTTSEVYGSYCFGGKYSPIVAVNYDFDEANGYYASLSAGYDCVIPGSRKAPSLGLSAKLGCGSANHNSFYYGADKDAITDGLIAAALPITVSDRITITPSISYSTIIDSDLKAAVRANDLKTDNFFIGVTVSSSL